MRVRLKRLIFTINCQILAGNFHCRFHTPEATTDLKVEIKYDDALSVMNWFLILLLQMQPFCIRARFD